MTIQQIQFNKDVVDRLLSVNTKNRAMSKNRVAAIARAMADGKFVADNGQTIVVNESFTRLLDGQHRLAAIRKAGYPVYTFSVALIPDNEVDEKFNTIDVVRGTRRASQVLGLQEGFKNSSRISSVCSLLATYAWGKYDLCPSEIEGIYRDYEDEFELLKVTLPMLGGKVPRMCYFAGVLNAMLICPERKEEIGELWKEVRMNTYDRSKAGLNSLFAAICSSGNVKHYIDFFKATKAMLKPDIGILVIRKNENLSEICCEPLI